MFQVNANDSNFNKKVTSPIVEIEHDFEATRVQARNLPTGWEWHEYADMSGHLESPDGAEYIQYDVLGNGEIEYKKPGDSWGMDIESNSFTEFKTCIESQVSSQLQSQIEQGHAPHKNDGMSPIVEIDMGSTQNSTTTQQSNQLER